MDSVKIDIIGRGNVAQHLLRAFLCDAALVNPHSLDEMRIDADFFIIAVSDNAVYNVAHNVATKIFPDSKSKIIAHTAGSVGLIPNLKDAQGNDIHSGVFYPLQTFTKNHVPDYSIIPFLIEASSEKAASDLMNLARRISDTVILTDSDMRRHIHLAAVVACNFANHLWTLSEQYLNDFGIDFRILLPLISETARKIQSLSPKDAQTGPAARGDLNVVKCHLDMLKEHETLANLYHIFSQSLTNDRI